MTNRGKDDSSVGGTDTGPSPRAPVTTPRFVVRTNDPGAGESGVMSAADTAVAHAVSVSSSRMSPPTPTGTGSGTDSGSGATGATSATHGAAGDSDVISSATASQSMPGIDSMVGTTLLGRYSVTRKIGQGGMGAVYEATHMLIGKRVAVKVLLDKYARKEAVVARLEQEARLASSIGHEHIIDITDFGLTDDGRTFVVMEFLEGESLAECLAREGPLSEQRILQITIQIVSALGAAHAKGVVHRDVKPENVFLLRRNGRDFVKVVDFGISKSLRASDAGEDDSPRLTQTGMVLGTPLYMSPEQARGDDELDQRIDLYAVGVIMYELSTGRVPFSGGNYLSIISQVLNDDPPPPRNVRPALSEEFEAIVLRALEKERGRRYQSTTEMLLDLNALADDPGHSTQREKITAPRRQVPRRTGLRVLQWVAGIAVIIGAVALTVRMLLPDSPSGPTGGTVPGVAPPGLADAGATPASVDAGVTQPIEPVRPTVEVVKIRIETKPPGATIYEGGRVVGTTPFEYEAPADSERIDLVAELAGYDDSKFSIRPVADRGKTAAVRLDKVKSGAQPKKVPKRPGTPTTPTTPTRPDDTAGGDFGGNPFRDTP